MDGVASEDSNALIEEHLKECADCREYLRLLQEDIPDVDEVSFADEAASLKKIRSKMLRNRILIVLVTLAFAVIAGAVLHSQHLTEYSGSLDENLSYKLPAGYEPAGSSTTSNLESKTYVRETADTRETMTLYYDGMYTNEEDEIVEFIRTIEFHRPDGSDLNALQRLYHNLGAGGMVVLMLTSLLFVGIPIAIALSGLTGFPGKDDETVITSSDLHDSMNRERKAKGDAALPSINNVQGASSNNLARRDHSWKSVPDFFIKLFRK